ncbi:phasin family protein [Novosphingobium sp. MW5]|nr:phasin family protein [Novosphingobium sp. MW5]
MAEATENAPIDSAEKAYAEAAAEAPVVLPALKPEPVAEVAVEAPKPAPKAAKVAKAAPKPAPLVKAKTVKMKPIKTAPVAAKKAPVRKQPAKSGTPTLTVLKEKIMAKTTKDFTATVSSAFSDLKEKAKSAFEKGTASAGEATEFAKGNVEALVESGKIFAEGAKVLGADMVAESKTAFETMTADVKEMAAIKSPADFFKFQSELMRRNFDAVVAAGSKNTEAMFKLANDSFAPISTRVSLAVEKVSKAA